MATPFGGVSAGEAYAVTVAAGGEVVVTGSGISGSSGWDLVTVEYDPAGVQQWAAISENPDRRHAVGLRNRDRLGPLRQRLHCGVLPGPGHDPL